MVAQTRRRPSLPLRAYADAVSIAAPYVRAWPTEVGSRAEAVRQLVARLSDEGVPGSLRGVIDQATDAQALRQALRALLTIRHPKQLPPDLHRALDGLLEGELLDRGIVEARSIPRLTLGTERSAHGTLALWQGDITTLRIDAIVNAANAAMLGCFRPMHACIDNAIHSGAGPRLREDCARIMAIQGHEEPTGAAKVTRGFNLPARYVLHTVGPIVNGPLGKEHDSLLTSCYHACLDLAAELGDARSVAFCSISTGVFGYPKAPAAATAIEAVSGWLRKHPDTVDLVVFNVFSDEDRLVYERALGIASTGSSNL